MILGTATLEVLVIAHIVEVLVAATAIVAGAGGGAGGQFQLFGENNN